MERAFKHPKNCFRAIHKKMKYNIERVKAIVKTTRILHNTRIGNQDHLYINRHR